MVNRILIFFIIITAELISSQWYFSDSDISKFNISSRSSSLGGVNLDKFPSLSGNSSENDKFQVYNSSMYDGIVDYSNIFYSRKMKNLYILGNHINNINLGIFNRKLNDVIGTYNVWNDEIVPPSSPDDINSSLLNYYNHNDYTFLVELFLNNKLGNFGIHFIPSLSKVDVYSSKSFSIDLSYSKYWREIFLGFTINNIFSYKKWDNQSVERFYPSLSLLVNKRFEKINSFFEIDSFFVNGNDEIQDKIKIGLEYSIYTKSNLRIGYNSNYISIGFGVNVYDKIIFDYSYLKHSFLGSSNQITLTFLLHNKTGNQ